ncbi:cold shock CspA family protein [Paraburkholderia sp. WC7.3d]|uniref:Cold-shock protein n=1 Tax=Paraburkholderia podalyriae TaxID=1938811 RepID=A0ABR7Q053_9BURK|nr:cold-shock protein [Paraburkholderia podalyriae]
MATGTVKWFNAAKGLGCITPDGSGEDLFAHFSEISAERFKAPQENKVSFDVKIGPKGKQAANIKPVQEIVCLFAAYGAGASGVVLSRRSRARAPVEKAESATQRGDWQSMRSARWRHHA